MSYPGTEEISELQTQTEEPTVSTEEPQSDPGDGQQSVEPQQTAQPQAQPQWNGKEFALNFRGKQVVPESRDKLINWAQLGYSYDKRAAELKAREEAVQRQSEQYRAYADMAKAFEQNPVFKQRLMQMYYQALQQGQTPQQAQQTAQSAMGVPQGQQGQQSYEHIQPVIQPLLQQQQELARRLEAYEAQQADASLNTEAEALMGKYPDADWNTPDEDGATFLKEVMQHAYQLGGVSLETAYRDLMYDKRVESIKAETLKKQQDIKMAQRKQGVVAQPSAQQAPAPQKPQLNLSRMTYDEIARAAKGDLGIK